MTVADLQAFLSDLSKFLRNSEAAKPAGEIEEFCSKLTPFRERKLKDFGNMLAERGDFTQGTIPIKKPAAPKKQKADQAAISEACNRVIDLYNRAVDPAVTVDQIEDAIRALDDLNLAKATLDALAKQMAFEQKFKAKADVIKAMRQRIIGRKGAADRINA